jgi:hypothetical protein
MKFIVDLRQGVTCEAQRCAPGRLVEIACEDGLLQRPHVEVKQVEPLLIIADLVHVDVARGDSLIPALQPLVLGSGKGEVGLARRGRGSYRVAPIAPLSEVLGLCHKVAGEPLCEVLIVD